MVALLNAHAPEVRRESVGYLTHNAHIAVALLGEACAPVGVVGADGAGFRTTRLEPLQLSAKGACRSSMAACATGLACLALERASAAAMG